MGIAVEQLAERQQSGFADPTSAMADFYTWQYKTGRKFDSTDESRKRIIRRLHNTAQNLNDGDIVLDLASGPQAVERQFISSFKNDPRVPNLRFISLDRATIHPSSLLARKSGVDHIQADGAKLPIREGIIASLISNMGLEYMDRSAIKEIHRILKPKGRAHLNIWTKKDSWENIPHNEYGNRHMRTPKSRREQTFWQTFLASDIGTLVGQNPQFVRQIFEQQGFKVKKIEEIEDLGTSWLEIDLVKTPTEKVFSRKTGRLISKIIATRKAQGKGMDKKTIRELAHQFQKLNINPRDPSNPNKSINFTTLIAKIDTGEI